MDKEGKMGKLDGRIAIITGGARGIGKQIALTFAMEGADIVIGDVLVPEMQETEQEIRHMGRKAITVEADVSKKRDVIRLVDAAIENFNKIDILVNNAGITRRGSLLEMREEDWDRIHDINLKGTFLCTQAVIGYMIQRKYGKIINMASCAGLGSYFMDLSAYAASKAGVVGLTKYCAKELGPYGINVNAIAPGQITTSITFMNRTSEEVRALQESSKMVQVIKKSGTPQDMANIALFLASDESEFISAQVISSDGGRGDHL